LLANESGLDTKKFKKEKIKFLKNTGLTGEQLEQTLQTGTENSSIN